MTTTEEEEPMATLTDRPVPSPSQSQPSKPRGGGARLLSFLLQTLVMAAAFLLFFLFAGVAALVLVHLFVAGRSLRRRRRRRFLLRAPGPSPTRSWLGLSADELERLPSFDWSDDQTLTLTDCAVCLEGLREGEGCRLLPGCGHCFHRDCVDRWLVRTPACPICRGGVGVARPEIAAAA
ncbi:putative RING-H2 finger protein ATL56 [Iris pallida]|uniref:RING-H2 finger protein ATL56 n=1 Tax=Iris pallida TaxID=29817 RepID=A0AAX6IA98_IRIPA|nr:putative RING-H2 finger protein ATL56 [Iris pallida]